MAEHAAFPFVVGCGRSGTTLVRAMLDAHPDMAVPYESYFPVWFARNRARYEASGRFAAAPFIEDLVAHDTMVRWNLDPDVVRARLAAAAPTSYPDAVRATFALYAETHGKPRYADKTPIFVMHIPLLASLFPEAVFVHLVRDGRDVTLSRTEVNWGTRRFEHEALVWREQVTRGRADGLPLGAARYREIRYEALLDDPERTARELCELVGLEFDPRMLHYYEALGDVLTSQPFADEHRNLQRPPTKGLRDWRSELGADRTALFDALAGATLDEFGYERGAAAIAPAVRARAALAQARYRATLGYRSARRAAWRAIHRDATR